MEKPNTDPDAEDVMPRPITPEKVRLVRARIAVIREDICKRGPDPDHFPDP